MTSRIAQFLLPKMLFLLVFSQLAGGFLQIASAGPDKDNPSLGAALSKEGIPLSLVEPSHLNFRISSGEVRDTTLGRIFAYYAIPRDADSLSDFFYLFRQKQGRWQGGKIHWPDVKEVEPDLANDSNPERDIFLPIKDRFQCQGGSLFVQAVSELLVISGHMGPSADCALILDSELQPVRSFYKVGNLEVVARNLLLVTGANIHFAPTHPLRMWLLQVDTGEHFMIYPATKETPARRAFRHAINMEFQSCEAKPECWQVIADGMYINDSQAPTEYARDAQVAADGCAFLIEVNSVDARMRNLFNASLRGKNAATTSNLPEVNPPWKVPHFFVVYRGKPTGPNQCDLKNWQAISIEKDEFVARFSESATKSPPDQALLKALWPDMP